MSNPAEPTRAPLNTFAVVAIALAYPLPVVGIVLGIMARVRIRKTGERGAGLALAAIIVGIVFAILNILIIVYIAQWAEQLSHICTVASRCS